MIEPKEKKIRSLVSTSVSDARNTLENELSSSPANAACTALALLLALEGMEGQRSRRQAAASALRKAALAIAQQ